MPIEWNVKQDNLIEFVVSDKLGFNEFQSVQSEMANVINNVGACRVLVLLKDFAGWEANEGWGDASTEHIDPYIKKFAIVGDEKWRDLVEVFTLKGLRPVPIEYFATEDEASAREWLEN
jgi:hypothetical protein